jgi:hypothetical protein
MWKLLASATLLVMLSTPAWATDFNWDTSNDCLAQEAGFRFYLNPSNVVTANWFQEVTEQLQAITNATIDTNPDSGCSNCERVTWTPPRLIGTGDTVHFGISIQGSNLNIPYFAYFVASGGTPDTSCPPILTNLIKHDKAKTIGASFCPPLPATAIVIRKATAEYYANHQPLATLNATTNRKPLTIETLKLPSPRVLGQCQTFSNIHYAPVIKAKFVVFAIEVAAAHQLAHPSHLWAQYSLPKMRSVRRKFSPHWN